MNGEGQVVVCRIGQFFKSKTIPKIPHRGQKTWEKLFMEANSFKKASLLFGTSFDGEWSRWCGLL